MKNPLPKRYFITGGAGFIGAHFVNRLLDTTAAEAVVYDNFSHGRRWVFGARIDNKRLTIIDADVAELEELIAAMTASDVVYHLAANCDSGRAANEPGLDFWNGYYLTQNVLEAMRQTGCQRILFASSAGVYGAAPPTPLPETHVCGAPISTAGAAKLASEALISAYCHLFGIQGAALRCANIVGPHQTHGVVYDFIRRLLKDKKRLLIYGNGRQTKPYIHIGDALDAFQLVEARQKLPYDVFNVAGDDGLSVTEIAGIVTAKMNLRDVVFEYTGGARGWPADVPVYRLKTDKIRKLAWQHRLNSRQAVEAAAEALLADARQGRLDPAA